ncbi:hypothetical protein V8C44DRAFT_326226 [Trichoderma aethiopicum]
MSSFDEMLSYYQFRAVQSISTQFPPAGCGFKTLTSRSTHITKTPTSCSINTTPHTTHKRTSQYRTVIQTRANSETASQLVGSAVGVTLRWFECRNGNSAAAKASPTLSSPFSLLQLFLHNQKPSRLLLLSWPWSLQRVNVNLQEKTLSS